MSNLKSIRAKHKINTKSRLIQEEPRDKNGGDSKRYIDGSKINIIKHKDELIYKINQNSNIQEVSDP